MLALFVEARRSDHWAMLIHHVATMTLIAGSYACNFVPIGALVMITHDAADSFLEVAKIFNYMCKARPWAQKVRAWDGGDGGVGGRGVGDWTGERRGGGA
jgi:hypothetical protein